MSPGVVLGCGSSMFTHPVRGGGRLSFSGAWSPCSSQIGPCLWGGDFNKDLSVAPSTEGSRELRRVCSEFELVDIFRAAGSSGPGFTWSNSRGMRSHLDGLFVPRSVAVSLYWCLPVWVSDHCMVGASLPVGLLKDPAFISAYRGAFSGWVGLRGLCPSWTSGGTS